MPAAPAAPVPTIKQEAATQEVLDLTADSDDDGSPAAAAAMAAPAAAAPVPAAAPAAAAPAPAAAAAVAAQPPAWPLLPDASSPANIQEHVLELVAQSLAPLLPQYVGIMGRLRKLFEPLKRAAPAQQQQLLRNLRCNYKFLQAAVQGGQLDDVLDAVEGLDAI